MGVRFEIEGRPHSALSRNPLSLTADTPQETGRVPVSWALASMSVGDRWATEPAVNVRVLREHLISPVLGRAEQILVPRF